MTAAKIIGILQPSYLPWLGYFEQIARADCFVLYDDVQFEKGSWRNRNRIKGPRGAQWLTVPVLTSGRGLQLIRHIEIDNAKNWRQKHIRTIWQNYRRAPFFETYAEPLFAVLSKQWRFLIDLNMALIRFLCRQLGIDTPLLLSSDLGISGAGNQRLIDLIGHLKGSVFYEGAAGRNYLDVERFEQAGIQVRFQDYPHPQYRQQYEDFIPYLSVIDLMFNQGSKSLDILCGRQV